MFSSGVATKDLISCIKAESDIALDIENDTYIQWINSLEQLLYTEVIRQQGEVEVKLDKDATIEIQSALPLSSSSSVLNLNTLTTPDGEDNIRFEDIYTVFADDLQLIKTTLTSAKFFPNTYYKTQDNKLGYNLKEKPGKLKIIYIVRPAIKTWGEETDLDTGKKTEPGYIKLPIEFIELVKSKLRGEAYKLANEDSLAAKWLNDYNVLLETFKQWINDKKPGFGM